MIPLGLYKQLLLKNIFGETGTTCSISSNGRDKNNDIAKNSSCIGGFTSGLHHIVYFAAFEHHIGFYPIPSGIAMFKKELSSYKQGTGSVQFSSDDPIPYNLVRRIILFRVKEMVQTQKKG